MSEKLTAMLAVSSSKADCVNDQRRIRVCGIVLVPDDFPETEMDWEKWLVEVTINPIEKFVAKYPLGDASNVILALGPAYAHAWQKKGSS